MLVLVLAGNEPGRPLLDQEEGRTVGRGRQHRVKLSVTAVRNELLGAVDLVALELAVLDDPVGLGANRGKLAPGQRLGDGVGDNQAFIADATKPVIALLFRRAHDDGIGAEKNGQECGGHAEIQARHIFGNAVHVVGRASESSQLFRNKQQVQPNLGTQELLDESQRKLVLLVEVEAYFCGQLLLSERPDGVEKHLK